jgi:hypothetical protein
MVADIISDLELDEDPGTDSMDVPLAPERLDQIRLYLASYYLTSAYASPPYPSSFPLPLTNSHSSASAWGRSCALTYTDYTARCSDLLQHHSPLQGDHILAWQVRLERLVEETNDLRRTQRGRSQSEYQISLMIRGMETQLAEWQARMAMDQHANIAQNTSIRLAVLFTRVFLSGAPLLKLPSVKLPPAKDGSGVSSTFRADPARLLAVVPALHEMYDFFLALDPVEVNSFIGVEWGALILSVILGFRMSFPLLVCPEWDDRRAREVVRFGEYIDRLCRMGDGGVAQQGGGEDASGNVNPALLPGASGGSGQRRSMDVLSASKIVLEMVKRKFERRVAKLEKGAAALQQQQQQQVEAMLGMAAPHPMPVPTTPGTGGRVPAHESAVSGCPMMDGSLEPYYPYWDETFNSNLVGSSFAMGADAQGGEQGVGAAGLDPGLWTAMTMGWGQGDVNLDLDTL